ncbi:MAG: hypothetical protein WA864_03220 [Acetobacteraceae bacterium]
MSWCDKLASVPTVGIMLDWHFSGGSTLWAAFAPILDKEVASEKPTFVITQNEPFSVGFQTDSGFHYAADQSKVVVGFQHRFRAKQVSGGHPEMEMLSRPMPFSLLLPSACERASEAALLLPGWKTRKIIRVGIVSTTIVDIEDAPPGVGNFIDYIGRPWGKRVDVFSFQIITELESAMGWKDRCIHNLTKPEDPEALVTLSFDWQRTFTSGQVISTASVGSILARARGDAMAYFEDLAEGSRFDENVVSATTRT